jgi:hypothetical protein
MVGLRGNATLDNFVLRTLSIGRPEGFQPSQRSLALMWGQLARTAKAHAPIKPAPAPVIPCQRPPRWGLFVSGPLRICVRYPLDDGHIDAELPGNDAHARSPRNRQSVADFPTANMTTSSMHSGLRAADGEIRPPVVSQASPSQLMHGIRRTGRTTTRSGTGTAKHSEARGRGLSPC